LGDFVVKAVPPESASQRIGRALLRREAVVARAVSHPHLTTVLADHSADERPYLLLPYLEGTTLARVLESCILGTDDREVLLPISMGCLIARQAAEAIAALHEREWLHGDVTPANVHVATSGHATLLDLGLARRAGSEECRGEMLLGPMPGYAAPELFSPRGRLTPAGDVYSLGVLLFELLAGNAPFVSPEPMDVIRQHRHEAPPDLSQLRPTASQELTQLVRRMLAKEPLRRPGAADVVRWLTELEIAEFAS
jgi:eukaryotic-like serine/threonine-protein kinase